MDTDMKTILDFANKNWIITVEKNNAIIYQKDPVKYIYFLLEGRTTVMNYIPWMDDNVIDYFTSPAVFGLVEYLNNDEVYTAFVAAETRCKLLRFPVKEFDKIVKKDVSLCYQSLLLLGKTTKESMNSSEIKKLLPPLDSLGNYLFQLAHKSGIPYECPMTRATLSEELHINIRTLYRYINCLQERGLLQLQNGRIIIEQAQFDKLSQRYSELIL